MARVHLENITATYNHKTNVLENYNLAVEEGELVSLLGESGCGKSTALKVLSGFLDCSAGKVLINGDDYSQVSANKRNFGIVFQSYALFPNMSVFNNVAFGLQMRKTPRASIEDQVNKMLKIVNLYDKKDVRPQQLSGGQRQRVALARALVINPDVLLLDEPLSNLDAKLRLEMRAQIRRIQQKFNITSLFVTHDQEECFSISDKVAIMNAGKIVQYDRPENIYKNPASLFVAKFIGFENFIPLKKTGKGSYKTGHKTIKAQDIEKQGAIMAGIRPTDILMKKAASNSFPGKIALRVYLGQEYQYLVETEIGDFYVNAQVADSHALGEQVMLHLPSDKIVLF